MSHSIAGYPGVSPGVEYLVDCTPELCSLDLYGVLKYQPSAGANIAFMAIFGVLLLATFGIAFRHKTPTLTIAMSCGLILEIIGYWARFQMRRSMFNDGPFLLQIICLTIAPIFFCAALYLTLSRVIVHYGPHNSLIAPRVYTLAFITADVIALIMQSIGGGLANSAASKEGIKTGENVMLAGLSFQVISLTVFIGLCLVFFWNVFTDRKAIETVLWAQGKVERPTPDVRGYKLFLSGMSFPYSRTNPYSHFQAWALATLLILARSIFRVAELAHGFKSALANDEIAFMTLEGGMILLATLIMTSFHPGHFIGEQWRESGWNLARKTVGVDSKVEEQNTTPREEVYMRPWPVHGDMHRPSV
ncbi:putative RTA1 domain protein [Amylocarpus encephaloides]|uniref:RTA1 domain protein n=1 Tax=Amylocarpus encephaloides TaxID=45428 RepID=A0A9P8C849_9HELO|nr:putative RTA1 domain protein [Amylocarpus encephaloides]